jgi:hypothetical protein
MLTTIRKAIAAAGFGLVGALGAAMVDGNLTTAEVVTALGVGLVAGAGVYAIPNDGA